jgi:DNA-binding transcriptional MerR regulator
MDKPLLRINEVAAEVGETVNVVRNWVQMLKQHIPLIKNDIGTNLFDEAAVQVIRRIQQLHRVQKFSMKQIDHNLATGGKQFGSVDQVLVDKSELEEIKGMLQRQLEFNQALAERLDQQEQASKQRDEKLNLYFQQSRVKQLEPKTSKWLFWKK